MQCLSVLREHAMTINADIVQARRVFRSPLAREQPLHRLPQQLHRKIAARGDHVNRTGIGR